MTKKAPVYLDHNASAPVIPAALDAMREALSVCGNPSSVHAAGRAARGQVERTRRAILSSLDASGMDLVFTSGGTEANALAIGGVPAGTIIVGATEHESVRSAFSLASERAVCPADENGVLDLEALAGLLDRGNGKTLVSVHLANNETGVIQPVAEIARLVHARGGLLHVDAVQAFGKISFSVNALEADLLTISAHKSGGPMGIGALIFRPGVEIRARQSGGGQERGRRAGTENVPAIAGFAAAVVALPERLSRMAQAETLRNRLESRLGVRAAVHGGLARRLPNTSCFSNAFASGEIQVMAMDIEGFQISSGAACSSGKVGASHVLTAMGVDADRAGRSVRVSLGPDTREEEVEAFAAAWIAFHDRLEASA